METKPHPKPALPLLALLLLASALGIAAAVVLAGVAMLLAAPAYAGEGRLLLEKPDGLTHATALFTQIDSRKGRTRVLEAYQNDFDESLGGVYVYRLPRNAVLEHLEFASNDVQIMHAVLMRSHATAIVERFTPIAPGETLVVELEYRTPELRALY